jgi:AraC family ethanolamine operon transcriptional activator
MPDRSLMDGAVRQHMADEPMPRAAAAQTLHVQDADAFAEAIRSANVEYTPLRSGPYDARLTVLRLGSIEVQRAIDGPHITRGAVAPDRIALLIPLGHLADPVVNGHTLSPSKGLLLGPAGEIHALCPRPQDWASFSLPANESEMLAEFGQAPLVTRGSHCLLQLAPHGMRRIQRAALAATGLCHALPDALGMSEIIGSLADGLRNLLGSALAGASPDHRPPRATREVMRIVAAAEEFLCANIERPIYTEELCRALAVSPRKLHDAFVSACGISPHAYLKLRRLVLVRRALRSGRYGAQLVKSAALAHGFWHLGNFARDYRAYFGESPSQTLADQRLGQVA